MQIWRISLKENFAWLLKTSKQNPSCTMTRTIAPSSLVACCPSHDYLNCFGHKASLFVSFVLRDPAQTKSTMARWVTCDSSCPLRRLQWPEDFQTCSRSAMGSVQQSLQGWLVQRVKASQIRVIKKKECAGDLDLLWFSWIVLGGLQWEWKIKADLWRKPSYFIYS